MHQIVQINGWIVQIKPEQTHRFTWKFEKEKPQCKRGRGFHYNSEKITMVTAWSRALGFLRLIDRPLSLEGVYYLYRWVSIG